MKITLSVLCFLFVSVVFSQQNISNAGAPITQSFSIGTDPNASLPVGFKMTSNFTTGTTATTEVGGTTGAGVLNGNSGGGFYNFANGVSPSATDRAIGFLSSNGYTSPRSIMYAFTNNTGSTILSLSLAWNYEKYRSGSRAFDWTFFHGPTSTATIAESSGDLSYPADATNTVVFNPPGSTAKTVVINNVSIPAGTTYYLKWTYTGLGGSTNAQALAIDDFSITLNTQLSNEAFETEIPLLIATDGDKILVKFSNNTAIRKVTIHDLNGKRLYSSNNLNTTFLTISELQKSNQFLFITAEDNTGKQQVRKIIF
jgi:hypothetical protein